MNCWRCGQAIEEKSLTGQVAFSALCQQCQPWLHRFKSYRYYQITKWVVRTTV